MKYTISDDGTTVEAQRLGELTPIEWTEVDMQYVLGLNPRLLGVEDDLPVGRDGGSTERMSDMLYVDEVGRATIVELKNEEASLKDLAQLLGYADHERQLPAGEVERRYLCAEHGWHDPWRERAIRRVRDLARPGQSSAGEKGAFIPLHVAERETFWQEAVKKWGDDLAFSLRGSPPRAILIGTDCSVCDEVTGLLQARWVNVRLVDANLLRAADGGLVLDWRPHDFPSEIDLMWEATRCLWRDDYLRENFEPNGWAEHRWGGYVSFSAKKSARVRFYLSQAGEKRVKLETWVPDKWCSDSERRRLNSALREGLADVPERSFSLPDDQDDLVRRTSTLAQALVAVLLPDL